MGNLLLPFPIFRFLWSLFGAPCWLSSVNRFDLTLTDAEAIAQPLEQHHYNVTRLPRKRVTENQYIIDETARLTGVKLSQELKTFLRDRAVRQDTLIYFAGHGFRVMNPITDEQEGYLATSDCTKDGQNAIRFDDLKTTLSFEF